jgi:hypothetical protein
MLTMLPAELLTMLSAELLMMLPAELLKTSSLKPPSLKPVTQAETGLAKYSEIDLVPARSAGPAT